MAATVRGAFELIDRASGTLQKIERQARKTQAAIVGVGAALDAQAAKSRAGAAAMEKHSAAMRTFEKDVTGSRKAVEAHNKVTDQMGVRHGRASRTTEDATKGVRNFRREMEALNREHVRAVRIGAIGGAVVGSLFGAVGGVAGTVIGGAVGAGAHRAARSDIGQFVSGKDAVKEMGRAVEYTGKAFGGLGSAMSMLKIPALLSLVEPLAGGIFALGGALVGVVPEFAAAAQAMFALPAAASAAVQAFGAVTLGLKGVMQAVSAGISMQNDWALNQQQFAQQIVQSTVAVTDAQHALSEAFYSQRQAQLQLTVARREAVRQLQDMEFQARSAVLQEAQSGLNVLQARQELEQAMAAPGTSQLEVMQRRLGLQVALADQTQQHVTTQRAQVDLHRALSRDPTAPTVMRVAQAQHAQAQSAYAVTSAHRSLGRAQYDLNFQLSQGNAGVQAYNKALRSLAPSQQAFVRLLVGPIGPGSKTSLAQQLQSLQQAAGEGLFPGLVRGIRALQGVFGPIENVMRGAGKAMGDTIGGIMRVFADPKWITNVGGKNNQIIATFGRGLIALAGAFKGIIQAGQPFVMWFARLFEGWARHQQAVFSTAAGIHALEAKLRTAEGAITRIVTVVRNLWHTLENIVRAAKPFNDWLWNGAIKGTKGWADWTGRHQAAMTRWFNSLKPVLEAMRKLFDDLAKAIFQIGGSGSAQNGAVQLVNSLDQMIPAAVAVLNAMAPLAPVVAAVAVSVAKILASLMQIPAFAPIIAGVFGLAIIGRFTSRLATAGGAIRHLVGLWRAVGRAKDAAMSPGGPGGMASPGTHGRPGAAGGVLGAIGTTWGVLSRTGPGSERNPLAVVVIGGGRLGGGGGGMASPGTTLRGGSSTLRNAERGAGEAARLAEAEAAVAGLSRTGRAGSLLSRIPLIGRFASHLPGALGVGARAAGEVGAATTAARAAGVLGEAGKIGGLVSGLARFAGPAGLALSALPAITTFFSTKGDFGKKVSAALKEGVSSATFGLVGFGGKGLVSIGAPSAAHQREQGTGRAGQSFSKFAADPTTGLLTDRGQQQYQARLAQLRGQITAAQHPAGFRNPTTGTMMPGHVDNAVVEDRQAQIRALNKLFDKEQFAAGSQASTTWTSGFQQAVTSGRSPKKAMADMITGLNLQMANLNPAGRRSLQNSLVAWGHTISQQDPAMRGPVKSLTDWIQGSFHQMGDNVSIINGQILDGSSAQWMQIGQNISNPLLRAADVASGAFGQIKREALGALTAMGFSKGEANQIIGGLMNGQISAGQVASAPGAIAGMQGLSDPSGRVASALAYGNKVAEGGRVMGDNPRDVYRFGQNLLGGGELVMNRHQEQDANARLIRHGEPTVGSIVANRKTPHWAYASGGRVAGVDPRSLPAPNYDGHPGNVSPGVAQVVSTMEKFWPGLTVTATRNGGHARGSYHYLGEAVDMASGDYKYMNRAAEWVKTSGLYRSLIEGIHNPNLSVHGGQMVDPGFWGATTWAGHANHLHLAITGLLGQVANVAGGAVPMMGTAAKQIKALKVPRTGLRGIPGALVHRALRAYSGGLTSKINQVLAGTTGTADYSAVPGHGGSSTANQQLGRRMMLAAGWGQDQWPSLKALWNQESSWDANSVNPSSGAYGIPQSLGHGHPYSLGDARSQIAWGLNYIRGRYGSPAAAEGHERQFNWYSEGGRVADAGWFGNGGSFVADRPTVLGVGERPGVRERVTVEPVGGAHHGPVNITIEHIEVNREGDVMRIVDEEMKRLADHLSRGH